MKKQLLAVLTVAMGINTYALANAYDESWQMSCGSDENPLSFITIKQDSKEHEQGQVTHIDATAFLACPQFIFHGVERGYGFTCVGVWEMDFVKDPANTDPMSKPRHVDTVVIVQVQPVVDGQLASAPAPAADRGAPAARAQAASDVKSRSWVATFTTNQMHGSRKISVPCIIEYNEGTPYPVLKKQPNPILGLKGR